MTRQKDLKLKIRARMQKTGESYTSARRQLLAKRPEGAALAAASAPPPAPPVPVAAKPAKVDYAAQVQPLFADRCYGCHGPDAQESDLRLDRKILAFKGGTAGRAIVPGQSADSPLYLFVAGLHEHGRMPPEGEGDPLSKSDVELIKNCSHWTQQERPAEVNAIMLDFLKGLDL